MTHIENTNRRSIRKKIYNGTATKKKRSCLRGCSSWKWELSRKSSVHWFLFIRQEEEGAGSHLASQPPYARGWDALWIVKPTSRGVVEIISRLSDSGRIETKRMVNDAFILFCCWIDCFLLIRHFTCDVNERFFRDLMRYEDGNKPCVVWNCLHIIFQR